LVTPLSSGGSKKNQCAQIAELIGQNKALLFYLPFLEAYCALAVSKIQDLKWWMNAQDAKAKKKKKLNVLARCLTLEEGLEACDQHNEEDRQKVAKELATAACKLAKEQERLRVCAEQRPIEVYTGTLSTKNKPNLQDIAKALTILQKLTCKTASMPTSIHTHNSRKTQYMGLFLHSTCGQK
jgi:hypothetical protein